MERIQVSAKIPKHLYDHFLLSHADRTAALIAALEKLYSIETRPKTENTEKEFALGITKNQSSGLIEPVVFVKVPNTAENESNTTENESNTPKSDIEITSKLNFRPTENGSNTIEIDLNCIESEEVKADLQENGFDEDKYLTLENELRTKRTFDEILKHEIERKETEFKVKAAEYERKISLIENDPDTGKVTAETLEAFKEFVSGAKKSLKDFESYSGSFFRRNTEEYSYKYLVEKHFSPQYHAILLSE